MYGIAAFLPPLLICGRLYERAAKLVLDLTVFDLLLPLLPRSNLGLLRLLSLRAYVGQVRVDLSLSRQAPATKTRSNTKQEHTERALIGSRYCEKPYSRCRDWYAEIGPAMCVVYGTHIHDQGWGERTHVAGRI